MALALCAAALACAPVSRADDPAAVAIHDYRGVIPVICYHGIYGGSPPAGNEYAISRTEFERQMAMLVAEGFRTVSIDQYARFTAGDASGLPDRPILITFDDGRSDSFAGADPVLARYGMRATMFVITAIASAPRPGYLGWAKLRSLAASGRWDLQLHANAGHVLVPTGPGSQTGPYYANLLYRNGQRETYTAFKRRVSGDILAGRRAMAAQIPGYKSLAFAVPYSNYGQVRTNYKPIPGWELGWLERTFGTIFVQDRRLYNLPGSALAQRYGIRATTTAAALRQWLGLALPRSAWVPDAVPVVPRRPARPAVRTVRRGRHTISILLRSRAGVRLRATRRRAGRRHAVRVAVRRSRVRDRRLARRTVYVYRVVAVDATGLHSRVLRLRLRTR
jgi:hypothetical protein